MGWDNRIFNVNGRGVLMLRDALDLVCDNGYVESVGGKFVPAHKRKISASIVERDFGLVWLWTDCNGCTKYPVALTIQQAAEISIAWLDSDEAKAMEYEGWDANSDHDGSNTRGWRVYCQDWGHVGEMWEAICAVHPAYLWHGK